MFDMYELSSTDSQLQIDANFGTPAAMIEMLVQSRPGRVELLPALPGAWSKSGRITGVGARNGLRVDLSWRNGSFTEATLYGAPGTWTTVVAGSWSKHVTIPGTGSLKLTP